jgi:flagellar motor switch protein FliN/FliY
VTTATRTTATDLLATAAASVVGTLASGEPLTVGEPTRDASSIESEGSAIVVQFTGAVSGDLVLVVDSELTTALRQSTIGPLDLVAALTPTIESAAMAMGPVVLGPAQEMDVRLALHRVLAHRDSAMVALQGVTAVRGAVAVGLDEAPVAAPPAAPSFERLDLLRGVEMGATAELGRARMTVNDLLSLRTGTVIELDRAAGAPADLFVNGRLIARGEVVVVDENYGLRITHVVADDSGR